MTDYKMLAEFIHYCSKCKLELNHRIILMDDDEEKPARVLCLTCNSERKFKEPSEATLKRLRKKSITGKTKAEQQKQEKEWKQKLDDASVTPKKYSIKESFTFEEHVMHPKFGRGLVIGFDHPDKIRVYFDDGIKILKGGRQEAA